MKITAGGHLEDIDLNAQLNVEICCHDIANGISNFSFFYHLQNIKFGNRGSCWEVVAVGMVATPCWTRVKETPVWVTLY